MCISMLVSLIFRVLVVTCRCVSGSNPGGIYEIVWENTTRNFDDNSGTTINVTTAQREKYTCVIPEETLEKRDARPWNGPSINGNFLQKLLDEEICSYKIETSGTYEVCHGKFVRQFKEIYENSRMKLRAIYLGKLGGKELEMLSNRIEENARNDAVKLKKIEGVEFPYVEISMSNGTPCEYARKTQRETAIFYMCDPRKTHEIYSVTEVHSCAYEIVIFTPFLCKHPAYRPLDTPKTRITCHTCGQYPPKHPSEKLERNVKFSIEMEKTIRNFLSGNECISGGTSAWKYEFCYGKHVYLYKYSGVFNLKTNTECLGKFDVAVHVKWLRNHPEKRPNLDYFTQLYATRAEKRTEVRLKCLENQSENSLVTYLYENNGTGNYFLGIESPVLCHIVPLVDENAMISLENV